ncbi:MAG: ABC transporter permease [Propionibacteriaceae bacterium]|jgi:peptide/nickel transport system permease protein|nr:ABC transporter permease [Propionibacteriaceae bacterium]
MGRVVGRWFLTALPVVVVVSMLTFVLASLVPGDPARTILGINAPQEQVDALRQQLGLDLPLPQRYWDWLVAAAHGDLGRSITTRGSVAAELAGRLQVTLSLVVLGLIVIVLVGVGLGLISAIKGGWLGRAVDLLSLIGLAVPGFWLGLVLVAVLAVAVPIFPATGFVHFSDSPTGWAASMALPVLTLALTGTAGLAKQTRSSVLDELGKDYVRMLRARGLSERRVILLHVSRNAGAPIVTVVGLLFIGLVSGAVLLETVFVLPGLGSLTVAATKAHDIPVILGVTLILSFVVVTVNLLVEISYALLNPKVRT